MIKLSTRIWALVCALFLLPSIALADIAWPDAPTAGQARLMEYIALVNQNQAQQGAAPVNSLFECYPTFAALGVTAQDMAEIPEGVELSITLENDSLSTLQLRVSDPTRFAALAASCIHAASPTATTLEDALATPVAHAKRALATPNDSFEEEIITLPGLNPRTYYAYYPNQYRDGVSWLQLTLIFPLPGSADAPITTAETPAPPVEDYTITGYDGRTHLEIFTTPTPEPDSPAGEK